MSPWILSQFGVKTKVQNVFENIQLDFIKHNRLNNHLCVPLKTFFL